MSFPSLIHCFRPILQDLKQSSASDRGLIHLEVVYGFSRGALSARVREDRIPTDSPVVPLCINQNIYTSACAVSKVREPEGPPLSSHTLDIGPVPGILIIIFPRNSHIFPRNSHIFLRNSHIFLRNSHIFPRNYHIFPRNSHIFPRNSHKFAFQSHT